jgi:hypothetical protein
VSARLAIGKKAVSHGRVVRAALVTLALFPAIPTAGQTPTFDEVMRRVHEYVTVYEDHELSTVMARERYHQQLLAADATVKAERTMLSDYVLIQLPDEDWVALRDVYEIDGATVGVRAARLKTLFAGPRGQLAERAIKMVEKSAEFNLGKLYFRTMNLPTYALRVLRPANRKRIVYTKTGEEPVDNTNTWIVAFREAKGPTFSAMPDGTDIPAHGRFWVDPTTGVVARSEMILGGTQELPARATITVTYGLEPSLGFRLPMEMRERYDNPGRTGDDVVVAVATYADFRRFDWRAFGRKQ